MAKDSQSASKNVDSKKPPPAKKKPARAGKEKVKEVNGPLDITPLTPEEITLAKQAYEDEDGYQVVNVNLIAPDGTRFKILESIDDGSAIVYRLPFSEKQSTREKNPFTTPHPYFFAKDALAARVRVGAELRMQDEKRWRAEKEKKQLYARQEQLLEESGAFNPNNYVDARNWIISNIVRRYGQPAFRKKLIYLYETQCAITDCKVEPALEAAHILPYKGPQTNHPSNGLLLRADLHTLFDLGLIAVDTLKMTILVSSEIEGTCYQQYAGKKLRMPSNPAGRPNTKALDEHRSKSCCTT